MIGDVVDTLRNTTQDVNQKFVEKIELRQVSVTMSHTQKIDQLANRKKTT